MVEGARVDLDDGVDPKGFMVGAKRLVSLLIENDIWLISTALSHKAEKVWGRLAVPRAF